MKKYMLILLMLATGMAAHAQFYSVSSNALGLATGNVNVEGAISVHRNWSIHLPVNYNPFYLKDNTKMQNFTVSPAVRYWFLETFSRHFVSVQGIYSRFHVGGKPLGERYEGRGAGGGISYGFAKALTKRLNIEFEAGAGILWADYTRYGRKRYGLPLGKERKLHIVPSRLNVSLAYLF